MYFLGAATDGDIGSDTLYTLSGISYQGTTGSYPPCFHGLRASQQTTRRGQLTATGFYDGICGRAAAGNILCTTLVDGSLYGLATT